jgi:polysaccharide biosynthesis protein PslG
MKIRQLKLTLILAFCLFLVLDACIPQTPIPVYVTPTPQASATILTTPIPTVALATPGGQQSVPTSVPPVTNAPMTSVTIGPSPTFLGPLIGPGYTLPATQTPVPTATPVPPTEGPTPTPQATITPLGPAPTALPNLDASRMGIQLDSHVSQVEWNEAIRRVTQDLHLGWIKIQLSWKELQPNGPQDFERSANFRRVELYLQQAKGQGLKILISVAKAPPWARSNQTEDGPPDDPQLLGNFLTFFLNINGLGSKIDAIEIWNEPNLQREWQGTLPFNGAGYMQLFGPAYGAIRAYSPTMPIITAGLAPTGGEGSVDDRAYLQQMYDSGLGSYSDISVGIHPYSWGNPPDIQCCNAIDGQFWDDDPHFFFSDTISDYRQIMVNNDQSTTKMWITEFGWATWDGLPGNAPEVWMTYNNQWSQANDTLRAFQIGQSTDYIGPMFLWNLNFARGEGMIQNRDERSAYSILLPSGMPERPLYWLLRGTLKPDSNCRQVGTEVKCDS